MGGRLSLTKLKKLTDESQENQPQITRGNPSPAIDVWAGNTKPTQEDQDESVRAFAEDTRNIIGATWPPRSYTCNFCRREFRSAQALGGHMNVHRRDRARLHQSQLGSVNLTPSPSPSPIVIPTKDFITDGGLRLLYPLPNPNGLFCSSSPSTILSVSSYPSSNNSFSPNSECHVKTNNKSVSKSSAKEEAKNIPKDPVNEELDLELRLGYGPMPT